MELYLVDFENVPKLNSSIIKNKDNKIFVFIGSNQQKTFAKELKRISEEITIGENFHTIFLDKTGKNYLDFVLSYELGNIDITKYKQVSLISNDKGYDLLLEYILNKYNTKSELLLLDEVRASYFIKDNYI